MKSTVALTIYDDQDNVLQTFSTNRIRWGVIEDVVELSEKLEGKNEKQAIEAMGQFLQLVFPTLTKELLRQADVADIKHCFQQIISVVKTLDNQTEKNVESVNP